MKKIKKLIFIIIIFIIILIISLLVIKRKNGPDSEESNIEREAIYYKNSVNTDNTVSDTGTVLNNASLFYTVEKCIQKYLTIFSLDINNENPFVTETGESINSSYRYAVSEGIDSTEKKNKILYDLLDKEYVEKNGITAENIGSKLNTVNTPLSFSATKIRVKKNDNVDIYSVVGRVKKFGDTKFLGKCAFKVVMDSNNSTFAIEPIDNTDIDNLDLTTTIGSVDNCKYNVFQYSITDELTVLQSYISVFKNNISTNIDISYEYIDEEYKNARFGSIEKFKKYVTDNEETIKSMNISKYSKNEENGLTRYICVDSNENYYIIEESATMQFKLILDTYTIDIPEFTSKYQTADNTTKAGMNIEKIKNALNAKDYDYVYSKFTSGFKENYFKTVDDYQKYVLENYWDKIKVSYNKIEANDSVIKLQVFITDATNEASDQVTQVLNIRLKEGTDFEFSFEV